jgi:hypothetical protein
VAALKLRAKSAGSLDERAAQQGQPPDVRARHQRVGRPFRLEVRVVTAVVVVDAVGVAINDVEIGTKVQFRGEAVQCVRREHSVAVDDADEIAAGPCQRRGQRRYGAIVLDRDQTDAGFRRRKRLDDPPHRSVVFGNDDDELPDVVGLREHGFDGVAQLHERSARSRHQER